jgi:hypothetical protein
MLMASKRVISILGGLAFALSDSAGAPASSRPSSNFFCMPAETDPADRAAIIRLYDAAAFDRSVNMVTRRLDAEALHQLERGVESGRPAVQISALVLLASALPHAIPRGEPTELIARAVAAIIDGDVAPAAADSVRLHARRVQWHLRLRTMTDPEERAACLAPRLNQSGADGVYYAYASVDYLAGLGAEGERVLQAFVAEGAKRSIEPEILGRAELGLRKIELSRQLTRSGPAVAVQTLVAAAKTPTKRQMDREFGKWVVGLLAMRRPEADSELQALADDASVTDEVQIAARFALTDDAKTITWQW